MTSFHVDDVFTEGSPETLKKIKEMIKLKFKIKESRKVRKFLGVYYEWGRDSEGTYTKLTMEKDVNKLVDGFENFTGSDLMVHKTPGDTGTTLSKSDIEEPKYIEE